MVVQRGERCLPVPLSWPEDTESIGFTGGSSLLLFSSRSSSFAAGYILSCSKAFPMKEWNPHIERWCYVWGYTCSTEYTSQSWEGVDKKLDTGPFSIHFQCSSLPLQQQDVRLPLYGLHLSSQSFGQKLSDSPILAAREPGQYAEREGLLGQLLTISTTLVWENLRISGPAVHCWFCHDLINLFFRTEFHIVIPVPHARTPVVMSLPWYCTSGLMNSNPATLKGNSGIWVSATCCLPNMLTTPPCTWCQMSCPTHTTCLSGSLPSAGLVSQTFWLPVARIFPLLPVALLLWLFSTTWATLVWPPHHYPRPGSDRENHKEKGKKAP